MKVKRLIYFILGLLIGAGITFAIMFSINKHKTEIPNEQIQAEFQAMNNRLDTLKVNNTTLIKQNDSIQVRIVKIKDTHEKTVRTIMSNDVAADYQFFSDYINGYMYYNNDSATQER